MAVLRVLVEPPLTQRDPRPVDTSRQAGRRELQPSQQRQQIVRSVSKFDGSFDDDVRVRLHPAFADHLETGRLAGEDFREIVEGKRSRRNPAADELRTGRRILAELSGQELELANLSGTFVWLLHHTEYVEVSDLGDHCPGLRPAWFTVTYIGVAMPAMVTDDERGDALVFSVIARTTRIVEPDGVSDDVRSIGSSRN